MKILIKLQQVLLDERSTFLVSSIFTGLLGLAFIPLLIRIFSIEEFSRFGSILLYTQILTPPLMFGFTNYLTSLYTEEIPSRARFRAALADWARLFFASIALCAIALLFLEGPLIVLVILLFSIGKTWNTIGVQTSRLERWRLRFFCYQFGIQLCFYLFVIIGVFASHGSAVSSFALGSLAFVIGALFAIYQLRFTSVEGSEPKSTSAKKSFYSFGFGAMAHSLGGVLLTQWDKFYTLSAFSDLEYANYIVAAQYTTGLVFLYTAFSQTIMPSIYSSIRGYCEGKSTSALGLFFSPATFGIFFGFVLYQGFVYYIFPVFLTNDLLGAVQIAQLLGIGAFFQGNYFLISSVIFYFKRTFSLSLITWSCVAISITTTIALRPDSVFTMAIIYIGTWCLFFLFSLIFAFTLLRRNSCKN